METSEVERELEKLKTDQNLPSTLKWTLEAGPDATDQFAIWVFLEGAIDSGSRDKNIGP